jgi:hypothetical protein
MGSPLLHIFGSRALAEPRFVDLHAVQLVLNA